LPLDTGSFVFWYAAGVACVTGVVAGIVARQESAVCAPDRCAGRPAGNWAAVRWLLSNLVFTDGGLSPATSVWTYGLLYRVLGLVTVAVVVAAAYRFVKWQRIGILRLEKAREQMPRALIVVAKQLERDAVIEAVRGVNGTPLRVDHSTNDTVYFLGEVGGVEVMLAESGGQGAMDPSGMLFTALGASGFYRPRYLILCGVCYGLDDERQQLGDVLVSQRVIDIDHKALLGKRVVIRGVNVPPGRVLLNRLKATTLEPLPYGVHFGPMVSSSTLLNSDEARAQLKYDVPHALGGEMEAASAYAAAAAWGIEWIVVKGIADWGRQKTYREQPTAARNAADFVVQTLQLGGLTETTEITGTGQR
jgi:nucleoside phosphorylase